MMREEKKYIEEVISIKRVTKVTSGGRQLRFQALVVVGDQKGTVGVGVGKAAEVIEAVNKAIKRAKKNTMKVDVSLGTIPHPIESKYKASKIILIPAAPGTGIIAGGVVRKILSLAGYHNILSKIKGSNNKLNNALATLEALIGLKDIEDTDYRHEKAKEELAMIEEQRKKEAAKRKKEAEEKDRKRKERGGRKGRKFNPRGNKSEETSKEEANVSDSKEAKADSKSEE